MNYMITNELIEELKDIFNEKLISIILYGSVAKGTDTDESNVDIAIILKWEDVLPFYKNVKRDGVVLWKAA